MYRLSIMWKLLLMATVVYLAAPVLAEDPARHLRPEYALAATWAGVMYDSDGGVMAEPQATIRFRVEQKDDEYHVTILGALMQGAQAIEGMDPSKVTGKTIVYSRENERWSYVNREEVRSIPELRAAEEIIGDKVLPLVYMKFPDNFEPEVGFTWGGNQKDNENEAQSLERLIQYRVEDRIDAVGPLLVIRGSARDVAVTAHDHSISTHDRLIHLDLKAGRARFAYEVRSMQLDIPFRSQSGKPYSGEMIVIQEIPLGSAAQ